MRGPNSRSALVGEIAQFSKTDVAPEEFYGQFLPRVVSALAAAGGAVWTLNPEGRLALQYQINLQETQLRDNQEHQAQHSRLLYKALSGSEGMLVPPFSGPGGHGAGRRRHARRQPHRVPPGPGPVEDRPGNDGRGRNLPAPRRDRPRRRAICGSSCRCANWPATFEEPPVAPLLRSPNAVDPVGGFHPRGPRLARSPRHRLHDRQRRPAAGRLRPRERGDPQRQEVQDRGHQRPGPVRQTIEHGAAA